MLWWGSTDSRSNRAEGAKNKRHDMAQDHPWNNQFTKPRSVDAFDDALTRPQIAERVTKAMAFWEENPDKCFTVTTGETDSPVIQFRCAGKRVSVSPRRLFWYQVYGTAPILAQTTCGNRGCCNPNHQRQYVTTPRQDRDGNVVAAF